WSTFELMQPYLDGTTSSSLYEAQLGYEQFKGEVHAYSVAFSQQDIQGLKKISDKVIFNSISQLTQFYSEVQELDIGLRINPQISCSDYAIADPACTHSRLGVIDIDAALAISHKINGIMLHYNCENEDFAQYADMLDQIAERYAVLLEKLDWVSLGGGVYFTLDDYPLDLFGQKLQAFAQRFDVQVYLEPGEAVITDTGCLVTQVLDIVHNEVDIAIVDSSIEAHMLDLLVYQAEAEVEGHVAQAQYQYTIAGKSCLAGDIFGHLHVDKPLKVGDRIRMQDAAGYTMVKKNWFNGVQMPAIVIKKQNGCFNLVKQFTYNDFKHSLS
uniref:hypothetical protein n=1 Tax=Candidatus Albibeggiatoa sp. nov. BB20 TaxID=3162723 RepID=UPI00336548AF